VERDGALWPGKVRKLPSSDGESAYLVAHSNSKNSGGLPRKMGTAPFASFAVAVCLLLLLCSGVLAASVQPRWSGPPGPPVGGEAMTFHAASPQGQVRGSQGSYYISVTETGLPCSATWTIRIANLVDTITGSCTISTFPYAFADGTYPWLGYSHGYMLTVPSEGQVTVSGAAASFSIQYVRGYNLTFSQTGLPAAESWAVNVTEPSDSLSLESPSAAGGATARAFVPNGTLGFRVDGPPGWGVHPAYGTVTVGGADRTVSLTFGQSRYQVDFQAVGLPPGSTFLIKLNGQTNSSATSRSLNFSELNGTFNFTIGPVPGYRASVLSDQVFVYGVNQNVTVAFLPFTYPVRLSSTGLPAATRWSVSVGTNVLSGRTPTLQLLLPNGTYNYTVHGVSGFHLVGYAGSFAVSGGPTDLAFNWTLSTYRLSFEIDSSGSSRSIPPAGLEWSVLLGTGAANSSNRSAITFQLSNGTYSFRVSTSDGNWTILANATGSTVVNGSARTVIVPVESNLSVVRGKENSPSSLAFPLLGLAALVAVGATTAVWLRRRRPPGPDSSRGESGPTSRLETPGDLEPRG
jgi:hypothetical protein